MKIFYLYYPKEENLALEVVKKYKEQNDNPIRDKDQRTRTFNALIIKGKKAWT
jgi:hypothetical protein